MEKSQEQETIIDQEEWEELLEESEDEEGVLLAYNFQGSGACW